MLRTRQSGALKWVLFIAVSPLCGENCFVFVVFLLCQLAKTSKSFPYMLVCCYANTFLLVDAQTTKSAAELSPI